MGFQLRDLTSIEPSSGGGSFTLMPKGDYMMEVAEISDEKATKDGTGKYVTFKYIVVDDGEFYDKGFFVNYNIENKNPTAQEIAWRDLSALGHAVGVYDGDSDALLYKRFMAKVGIEKSKNPQYPDDKNKIDRYYQADEHPMAAPVAPPAPAPAPVRSVPVARPWPKRAAQGI